jgi:hypothetical protein
MLSAELIWIAAAEARRLGWEFGSYSVSRWRSLHIVQLSVSVLAVPGLDPGIDPAIHENTESGDQVLDRWRIWRLRMASTGDTRVASKRQEKSAKEKTFAVSPV